MNTQSGYVSTGADSTAPAAQPQWLGIRPNSDAGCPFLIGAANRRAIQPLTYLTAGILIESSSALRRMPG